LIAQRTALLLRISAMAITDSRDGDRIAATQPSPIATRPIAIRLKRLTPEQL
jgi:hypothetical protein